MSKCRPAICGETSEQLTDGHRSIVCVVEHMENGFSDRISMGTVIQSHVRFVEINVRCFIRI